MNPLTALAACLNIGASIWHAWNGEWKMATIWFAYAVATGILSTIKGG